MRTRCCNAAVGSNPLATTGGVGRKASQFDRYDRDEWSAVAGDAKNNSSKLNERRVNVYENKGTLWKTDGQSRNVAENKGTYRLNPGMLLKTQGVRSFHGRKGKDGNRQIVLFALYWSQSLSQAAACSHPRFRRSTLHVFSRHGDTDIVRIHEGD